MYRILLLSIVTILSFCYYSANAQEVYTKKCKMTTEEILNIQSFHSDQVEYKKSEKIAEVILNRLELFYNAINNNQILEAKEQKNHVLSAINSAQIINMDFSMFDEDLEFLNNYNFN